MQYDIRPDGTVLRTYVGDCTEDPYRNEDEYVWRSDGPDAIVITDPNGDGVDAFDSLRVTPGPACDQLRVGHVLDGNEIYYHPIYRGAICLRYTSACDGDGCTQCVLEWCDEPPEPCE
jgi:hypothetical protein